MSALAYGRAVEAWEDVDLDWDTDRFRFMLVKPEYVPDQDRHRTVADVQRFEVKPKGAYPAGGVDLRTWTETTGEGARAATVFLAAPVTLDPFAGRFRYGIVYRADGVLVSCNDYGAQRVTASVDISFPDGVWGITQDGRPERKTAAPAQFSQRAQVVAGLLLRD